MEFLEQQTYSNGEQMGVARGEGWGSREGEYEEDRWGQTKGT